MQYLSWSDGERFAPGKIVCVGRNYADHAREMGAEVSAPAEPVLFMKPNSSLVLGHSYCPKPSWVGELHHEIELAVCIGERARSLSARDAMKSVSGYAIGLDFTARDVQARLKSAGLPWERAKAYDGSCLIGPLVRAAGIDPSDLELELRVNGERRQWGRTSQMLLGIPDLIASASAIFTLEPGDILLTGTPAGVGPLEVGDRVEASIEDLGGLLFRVEEGR